ncbi:MAG: class I SAM-dependent methyltransferase [Verrucomicrobiota bacterium]
MIQRLPFGHPVTAVDVARLESILREAFVALRFHRPGSLAVLNLACGRADETGALAAALAPMEIARYLGLDLRDGTIEEARKRWALPGGQIEFRAGDGSAIHRLEQMPAWDLIFIRHQNFYHDPSRWDRLFGNALSALAPSGLLVCTSYFDREHELMKASLRTRGASLLWDVCPPGSRPLFDAPGKSVDRRLAFFCNSCERLDDNPIAARECIPTE